MLSPPNQNLKQLRQEARHFQQELLTMVDAAFGSAGAVDELTKRAFLRRPDVAEITETLNARLNAMRALQEPGAACLPTCAPLAQRQTVNGPILTCSTCGKIWDNVAPSCRYCDTAITCRNV